MRRLSEAECREAMGSGEFPAAARGAAPATAIILTQSWCPQWAWMRSYLQSLEPDPGRELLWVEYDREPFFEPFMRFKESRLGNDEVPYVRYYRDGKLVAESNFIDRGGFLRLLSGSR